MAEIWNTVSLWFMSQLTSAYAGLLQVFDWIDAHYVALKEMVGSYFILHVALLLITALVLPLIVGLGARVLVFRKDAEAPQKNAHPFEPAAFDETEVPPGMNSKDDPQPAYEWSSRPFPDVVILEPTTIRRDSGTTQPGGQGTVLPA